MVGVAGRVTRRGGWAAVVGVGLFLGVAALFYTLLFGYAAFTLASWRWSLAAPARSWDPLLRLAVIAVIAGAIALIGWGPYLLAAAQGPARRRGHRAALPARRRRRS